MARSCPLPMPDVPGPPAPPGVWFCGFAADAAHAGHQTPRAIPAPEWWRSAPLGDLAELRASSSFEVLQAQEAIG